MLQLLSDAWIVNSRYSVQHPNPRISHKVYASSVGIAKNVISNKLSELSGLERVNALAYEVVIVLLLKSSNKFKWKD